MTPHDLTEDERQLLRAAHALGLVRTDAWPGIAAELLARGVEGPVTAELAGHSSQDSPWAVEPLVPELLVELGGADLDAETGALLVGRAVAWASRGSGGRDDFPTLRELAARSRDWGYPGGAIGRAHYLSDFLDCACHRDSVERQQAAELERALTDHPLDADDRLLHALTRHWL